MSSAPRGSSGGGGAASPPRVVAALLVRLLPAGPVADSIVGDLQEEHARRVRRGTRAAADRWYRGQALGIAARALRDRALRRDTFSASASDIITRNTGEAMGAAMLRSLRHGTRGLLRAPQFTLAAVLTLGLAIGTNASIFSVVQGVLLKPLSFPESERLVLVGHTAPGLGYDAFGMSPGLFHVYSDGSDAFDRWGFHATESVNVTGADQPPGRVVALRVSRGVLPTLGTRPYRGRVFGEGEAEPGGAAVVILSHGLWQERFGGDERAIGSSLDISGAPHTVIGIMPREFVFPTPDVRLWLPLDIDPANEGAGEFSYAAVARLRPGIEAAAAKAQLDAALVRLRAELDGGPDNFHLFMDAGRLASRVVPLKDTVVGDVGRALWILLGTVGFVFLIACANVANLFLVRAESRQREMAVRAALGAGRRGLVAHYAAEALIIAAAAGVLGLALAVVAVRALVAVAPPQIPRLHEIGVDPLVLAFAVAVTLVAALLLGALPALRLSAPHLLGTLSRGARNATAGRQRNRVRHALVVAQTALALVLLAGSGLMVRSFQQLRAIEPGFDARNTTTFRVALPAAAYEDNASVARFHAALHQRLEAIPGIEYVGATTHPPLSDCCAGTAYVVEDRPVPPGEMPPMFGYSAVTPGWFEAMGIRMHAGRSFDATDQDEGRRTVIVARAVARMLWPDEDAIGKRVRPASIVGEELWYTVVGVAADLRDRGLQEEPYPMVYFPVSAAGQVITGPYTRNMMYVLRTARPDDVAAVARAEVWAIDAQLPVSTTGSYQKIVAGSMSRVSFTMFALVTAAFMALLLGVVGLYSVLSYIVAQRTGEIGIRMALGADPAGVRRMVVLQGGRMVAVGLALGIVAALALTRLMQGVLYGTSPGDPATLAAVSALLGAVAVLAAYIPARRASRVDPAASLKEG